MAKIKVLLIEDNRLLRDGTTAMLKRAGRHHGGVVGGTKTPW
jgi:hypothetical protein